MDGAQEWPGHGNIGTGRVLGYHKSNLISRLTSCVNTIKLEDAGRLSTARHVLRCSACMEFKDYTAVVDVHQIDLVSIVLSVGHGAKLSEDAPFISAVSCQLSGWTLERLFYRR